MSRSIASLLLASCLISCGGSGDEDGSGNSGAALSTVVASALGLTVSSASLPNTGIATVTVTATAFNARGSILFGVPVLISVDGGASLGSVSGTTTSVNGVVTAALAIGNSHANRVVTVSATSGAISKAITVSITGTTVTASLVSVVAPALVGKIQYVVLDQASNPLVGQAVQIEAPGMTPAEVTTAVTDANGAYTYSYTAPAAPGIYPVTAVIAGVTNTQNITVQPTSTVPLVTIPIEAATVSANPSVVAAGSTTGSSIRALFIGTNNLPIQNVRAKFDLNGDPNSIGGTFAAGDTTLYSDVNGVVTTNYVPGSRSSPTNGVQVRVCYGVSDTDPGLINCTNQKIVSLTVTSEPLGVTIGTNGSLIVNDLTYTKKFVISVADSAGVAQSNVALVASVDLPVYRKGFYTVSGGKWTKNSGGDSAVCLNEDTNRNGVLDTQPVDEDINHDGQLWPRKPDVIVALTQLKTGADGTAELTIQYAQDHGGWLDALITVSASGVSGSEGRVTYLVSPVPVDVQSILNTSASPAYQFSPYGTASDCTNPN